MVIGESRFFSLDAEPDVNVSAYTSRWELVKSGTVVKTGTPTNTGTSFVIKVQTDNTMSTGAYEIRVFITDPVDSYTYAYRDLFTLEA